jgi:hypothetical protein
MRIKQATTDCRREKLECLGPLAVKAIALLAGVTVFVPLVAAFAAPFFG